MSNDSTVSSSGESIDGVYAIRHEWHSSNSQNENSGTGQVEISEFLRYPRNFFDRVTGGLPKDEEAACCLWPYRKARQNNGSGLVDMVAPDGRAMLNEMKTIRDSLRSFIRFEFLEDMRTMARHSEMKMESNAEFPVTPGDFKKILKSLINNPTNEIKVYDVFHKFHRDRIWIAHAIDKWFLREKMILEGEVRIQKQNGKCAKFFATDQGGFSSVARTVKAQIVKSYMLFLLRNTGWCIATTNKKFKSTTTTYTKIKISDSDDHYYMVKLLAKESSRKRCNGSSKVGTTNSCSTTHQEILDEDSVDISGVASKINQEYGINITEEKLAGILSSHRLLTGTKMTASFASPLHSKVTRDDNEVAGRLLLLNENSTLISGITEAVVAPHVSGNQNLQTGVLREEELFPTMEEMVPEIHSPSGNIDVVTEQVKHRNEFVDEEKGYKGIFMKHVSTASINDTTRTTRQELNQIVDTCNQDQV